MLRSPNLAVLLAAAGLCLGLKASDAPAPKIDKAKLEAFIRYTEGFTAIVKMVIDDPSPSAFGGFLRVPVHLSLGPQAMDKVYFVTPDGQQILNGSIWKLSESPWLDTLLHLPTKGPSFGPENAKVTMVVFSDLQCPYCRSFAKTIREELPKKYPNDVRVIFKDFPLVSIHKWALAAAEASHCIGDGNTSAFWSFHDWIFDHQGEVNEANLREKTLEFVKREKLDNSKISACLDTHATAQEVQDSLRAGEALGIQPTPTSFINGRMVGGALPWSNLDAIIQVELNRPREVPGPPSAKSAESVTGDLQRRNSTK